MTDEQIYDRARELDPTAWQPFHGQPDYYRRAMNERRDQSLRTARRQLLRAEEPESLLARVEQLEARVVALETVSRTTRRSSPPAEA